MGVVTGIGSGDGDSDSGISERFILIINLIGLSIGNNYDSSAILIGNSLGESLGKSLINNGLTGNGLTGNRLSGLNIGGRIRISFTKGFLIITGITFDFNNGNSRIRTSITIGINLTGVGFTYRLFFKYYIYYFN